MTIVSILLAFALCHFVRELGRARRYGWLLHWRGWCERHVAEHGALAFFIVLGVPLLVLGLVQYVLAAGLGLLGVFLLSLVVLIYTFGPRDLDLDVAAAVEAQDEDERRAQLEHLTGGPLPDDEGACQARAVEAVFNEALRRWFGVIFWFAVLGVFGALLYRMAVILDRPESEDEPQAMILYRRLRQVLDWPVAQLMTLALAIATDFDSVYAAWKQYHDEPGHGLFEGDNGFLLASARRIVLTGHAARDGYAEQLHGPLLSLQQAMDLAWRTLGVWLTGLALVLLISVFA